MILYLYRYIYIILAIIGNYNRHRGEGVSTRNITYINNNNVGHRLYTYN